MADKTINVLCICGSLRKGSYNRMVMNALPGLAPEGMKFTEAPSFAGFSIYNFDDQESRGVPPERPGRLADAIRAADGVMLTRRNIIFPFPAD